MVVALVSLSTTLVAGVGSVSGVALGVGVLQFEAEPLPSAEFLAATAILAITAAAVGALVPAAMAARRDPLIELRVP